jgi:hypothetical protein
MMRIKFYGMYGKKVNALLGSIDEWTEVCFFRYIWLLCGNYCSTIKIKIRKKLND